MRLYFMLVRRVPPVPSPVLEEAYETLRRRGFEIDSGIAEEILLRPDELVPSYDLYVLKSHTELSLSLAAILHTQGARLLNPYPSCALTQNKLVVTRILQNARVPVPRSWVTADLSLLRELVEETPLIIKPYMGHRGAGVVKVRNQDELRAIPNPEAPVIIQEYIEGDVEDLKAYVVGEQVFAVRKRFSQTSFSAPGRPVPVSEEVRDLALRAGRSCGLGLYGLDIIESSRGLFVVDVNCFPGYKGVPHVGAVIADYIEDYARARSTLSPLALVR